MTIAIKVLLVKCPYLGSLLRRMPMSIHHWAAIVQMKMTIEGRICCKMPGSVVSRTPMPSHYRKNSRSPAINHRAPRVVKLTTLDHLLVWIDSHHLMALDLEVIFASCSGSWEYNSNILISYLRRTFAFRAHPSRTLWGSRP